MKQFVKRLDKEAERFQYVCSAFPGFSIEKMKQDIFDGLVIQKLIKDVNSSSVVKMLLNEIAWMLIAAVIKKELP